MRVNRLVLMANILWLITFTASLGLAGQGGTAPTANKGAKWRLGYLEGGPYTNYQGSLQSMVQTLMDMGWIEQAPLPALENSEDTQQLWSWLSTSARSDYLQFVPDAYWSAGWDNDRRRKNADQAVERLNVRRDIDLMMAMGTWAGQDLVPGVRKVAIVVMSCSDPVSAGIIRSNEDSGWDNVTAWVDPNRYLRRHRLFHDILNFKRLGVIYENSENGRVYAGLDSIRQVAGERGFEVIECHAQEVGLSFEELRSGVAKCVDRLAPLVDAFTVTDHNGQLHKFFPDLIQPFFEHKVSVYTPVRGPLYVRRGVLMGIAKTDYEGLGSYYAGVIAEILNGARPRDVKQEYKEPLKLVLNLEAARRIGYQVPKNLEAVADEVYQHIDATEAD